jgi:hypothetical protein
MATITNGGTLDISTAFNATVTFAGGIGTLVLDQPDTFSGQISGFTGTAPDAAHSDAIDLVNINYDSSHFLEAYNTSTGQLTVSDGSNVVSFTFNNFNATLDFASDGNGGTLITDPPASTTTTAAATTLPYDSVNTLVGGSNSNNTITDGGADTLTGGGQANQTLTGIGSNDTFVFTSRFGHDTITNFQPKTDVLQIDHSVFANVQALLAATQDDGHGNAVITADLHDSITLQHVTLAQLQAHHSDFHII